MAKRTEAAGIRGSFSSRYSFLKSKLFKSILATKVAVQNAAVSSGCCACGCGTVAGDDAAQRRDEMIA